MPDRAHKLISLSRRTQADTTRPLGSEQHNLHLEPAFCI